MGAGKSKYALRRGDCGGENAGFTLCEVFSQSQAVMQSYLSLLDFKLRKGGGSVLDGV